MKKSCPKCKSSNVKLIDYLGVKCVICKKCGFDESNKYEVYPEQKISQKAKGRFTPYKTGGHKRTKKQKLLNIKHKIG